MKKKSSKNSFKAIVLFLLLGMMTAIPLSGAHATYITPKRVMINDKQRTATLTIHNTSDKTVVYRFGWERRAQNAAGETILLEAGQTMPGYNPADEMLQFSPRQVILKPKENQKLRILVRRPAGLADGEYHSHLLIKSETLPDPNEDKSLPQQSFAGMLKIQTNASIPIFLRQGKTTLNLKLTNAALIKKDGKEFIKYSLSNNSTRSVYAVPYINCVAGGTATAYQLNTARVYVESKDRVVEAPVLNKAPLGQCSSMTLQMKAVSDFEYKHDVVLTEIPIQRN